MELVSTEENKALVRCWLEEGYNKGNVAVVDQIIAADYVNHSAPHVQMPGQQAEKRYITMIRAAFSDFSLTIEDQIAEGDKVVTRLTTSGTYRGGLPDIPSAAAIGKRVVVGEILIHRIVDGRVVEGWIEFDQLGLWRQLGIFSTAEKCSSSSHLQN